MHIDRELLAEVGLDTLDDDVCSLLLQHIYDELELRVGMTLAEQMTEEQLDEFERFVARDDPNGARRWLDDHLPHYPQVTRETLAALRQELAEQAEAILHFEQELAVRCETLR